MYDVSKVKLIGLACTTIPVLIAKRSHASANSVTRRRKLSRTISIARMLGNSLALNHPPTSHRARTRCSMGSLNIWTGSESPPSSTLVGYLR